MRSQEHPPSSQAVAWLEPGKEEAIRGHRSQMSRLALSELCSELIDSSAVLEKKSKLIFFFPK